MNKYFRISLTILFIALIISNEIKSQIIDSTQKWIKVTGGLNFPEGPAYDGKSSIYLSNCSGGWIAKSNSVLVDTFVSKNDDSLLIEKTNGTTIGKDGFLYVCEYGKGRILRIDKNAKIEIYANGYNGEYFNRPNDLTFDELGNLFFTDPKSYDKNILDGRIFFVDVKTKEVILLDDSLAFPNGINISPIYRKLYVCESVFNRIIQYEITSDNKIINKEVFAIIPGGDPDGIEFDINGNLYVAHFGGKAVYIFSPEGNLLQKIETPGSKPTNLEFGDEDYQTLYLTEVETNSLYKIRTKHPGKNILIK
ncbi:MAG: SMP-30/gluconolactonase/LRE family protein [Ignavibacteriaceae bacterium]